MKKNTVHVIAVLVIDHENCWLWFARLICLLLSAQRCLNRYCTEHCKQDGTLLCLFFSESSSIVNICIYEPFFMRRVVALMGMYPLHFSTFVFQHFSFMISSLYIVITLNRLIRKENIFSCFFRLNGEGPGSV